MRTARGLVFFATVVAWLVAPASVLGFSGFGTTSADATFGETMTFEVELQGGAPEQLEIVLRFADDEASFVAPVDASGGHATYTWDAASSFVVPNTLITYAWRASVDGQTIESSPAELRYDDDRAGLAWQEREIGQSTVHWYGGAEDAAVRFGELTADGVTRGEALLGTELAGPIDVFVYDSREDFFGALGPGAREWTGAAAYPELRTVFMWLGGGPQGYLETALVHEVTHVVFHDATANPFHEPAQWLNEGIATWSEMRSADNNIGAVEFEAAGDALLAFEGITQAFPISDRGAGLAYSQGTVMIDRIVNEYGDGAIAAIAAAYRDGATDDEALEAGTGVTADELYDAFYAEFGADAPQPVAPTTLDDSDVALPAGGLPSPEPGASGVTDRGPRPEGTPVAGDRGWTAWPLVLAGVALLGAIAAMAVVNARRRAPVRPPPADPPPGS